MTLRLNSLLATATALVALSLCACADDDDPGPQTVPVYDMVELVATSATGATFTLQHDDSPIATLTDDDLRLDMSQVKVGNSLVIRYVTLQNPQGASGPINVLNYYPITNASLSVAPWSKIEGWDTEGVYLLSVWRSGGKINLNTRLPYDTRPRLLALVVDEATVNDPVPEVYLATRRESDTPTFDRRYFISFDISALWNRPNVKGVNIHIANTNLKEQVFTFTK